MKFRQHCILALITIIGWLSFYLVGIPSNYFQEWSLSEQILLSIIGFFSIIPFLAFIVIILINNNFIRTGIWFAFYASIPLAILDYIMIGIIKGEGLYIFISHWYPTIAYIYAWIIGPLMGYTLHKLKFKIN